MQFRGLVVFSALAALLIAAPAGARVFDHISFPDPAGDGDLDITQVTVGSNPSAVTFVVSVANRQELAESEYVFVLVDSDLNEATGEAPNGADFLLQLDRESASLFRWDGSDWQDTQSQTVYGYVFNGFRVAVNRSDLGLASSTLRFWVETQSPNRGDDAPDGKIVDYALSATPLQLTVRQFGAAAKTVKAGRQFVVGLQAHRSDLDELTSAGSIGCTAKFGRKAVKVTAAFPEDIAGCVGTAPRTAKGKTIKVTLTLELDGVRVSRTASIKVR